MRDAYRIAFVLWYYVRTCAPKRVPGLLKKFPHMVRSYGGLSRPMRDESELTDYQCMEFAASLAKILTANNGVWQPSPGEPRIPPPEETIDLSDPRLNA